MRMMVFLILTAMLASCSTLPAEPVMEEVNSIVPSATRTKQVNHPIELTATVTKIPVETPTKPIETPQPGAEFDFSQVNLFEVTHLMDPKYFQISLENWPADLPEGTRVEVDGEEFSCDELFPEDYPGRLYCWGLAPGRGENVSVQVLLPEDEEPVLEIPFTVPSPGGG